MAKHSVLFIGHIDSEEHVYGPETDQAKAETALLGEMLPAQVY